MTVTASHFKGRPSCGFSSLNVASLNVSKNGGRKGGAQGRRVVVVAQWRFVWGLGETGRQRVKNQNVEDISSQQIDTGPLILGSLFFFPPLLDTICIANGCSVALAFFLESRKKKKPLKGGDRGFPQHTGPTL